MPPLGKGKGKRWQNEREGQKRDTSPHKHTCVHTHTCTPLRMNLQNKSCYSYRCGQAGLWESSWTRTWGKISEISVGFHLYSLMTTTRPTFERVETKFCQAHYGQVTDTATGLGLSFPWEHPITSGSLPSLFPTSLPPIFFSHQPFNLQALVVLTNVLYIF